MTLLEQLQQLAPLAAAATAAPWKDHAILLEPAALLKLTANNGQSAVGLAVDMPSGPRNAVALCGPLHDKESRMTAAFIAAARNLLTPENLLALCAALAPQWVAVTERLPVPMPDEWVGIEPDDKEEIKQANRQSEDVLICRTVQTPMNEPYEAVKVARHYPGSHKGKGGWLEADSHNWVLPHHWMPLPAAPALMEGSPVHV